MSDTSLSSVASSAASTAMGSAPQSGDAKKIHETAQKFEAIFIRQMLAEARKSNMGDQLFSSQGTDTFREMQEQTIAAASTKAGGFGFAKLIEQRLTAQLKRTTTGGGN